MPKLKNQLPKMCTYRGRCHVWHNGQRIKLGKAGSEANRNYKKFINALTKESPSSLPVYQPNIGINVGTADVPVAKLCAEFLKERKGKVSEIQWDDEARIVTVLVSLYGDITTAEFNINCLRAVRNEFIQMRYVRQKINWRVKIAQFICRWGVSYKMVPASIYQELKSLIPLKKGEYNLPESRERPTVSLDDIEKTLAELSPVVRAMVIIHLAILVSVPKNI